MKGIKMTETVLSMGSRERRRGNGEEKNSLGVLLWFYNKSGQTLVRLSREVIESLEIFKTKLDKVLNNLL